MPLSRKQRKKREMESPSQKRRRERRKEKKLQARQEKEKQMSEYLLSNGWTCTGPMKDVWKRGGWTRTEDCYATIDRAYRIQQRLEASGYVQPAGIDDDLGAAIMGD